MALSLGLGGAGCQGIYHESEEIYPPDAVDRLNLRMDQARQAQKQADQAAAQLQDRATKGVAGNNLDSDVDRLEMAAREFGRRMAAVTDALADCGQPDQFTAEIERLRQRCSQWLETVQLIRSEGLSATLPRLERLLQSPAPP